jgi:hypothetical protein
MASPLYQQFQPQNNFLTMLNQFKQNPMAMLSKRFNIPQNLNDPNQILQYLLNTNQVSQAQVNKVMQMKDDPQFQNLFKQ